MKNVVVMLNGMLHMKIRILDVRCPEHVQDREDSIDIESAYQMGQVQDHHYHYKSPVLL